MGTDNVYSKNKIKELKDVLFILVFAIQLSYNS